MVRAQGLRKITLVDGVGCEYPHIIDSNEEDGRSCVRSSRLAYRFVQNQNRFRIAKSIVSG